MRVFGLLALMTAALGVSVPAAQEGRAVMKRPAEADPAVRCVLPGVPWIGFYRGDARGPEDEPFAACVRAFLEYRGDNLGLVPKQARDPWHVVHVYIKGACAASFRMGWDSKDWDWDAMALLAMPGDPLATFRDGLAAAGYGCEVLLRKDFAKNLDVPQDFDYSEATFRERIMASIKAGVPVLALGVVGPPECSLICGYDEGGAVLVGRSFFQGEGESAKGLELEEAGGGVPDPYFRKRDWFAGTRGLVLIGPKIQRPSDREIHVRSLRRALEIMRTPRVRGYWTGQAAFTMWADTLLKDALYRADNLPLLRRQHEVHHGAGGTLAEARAYGADYLRGMADREPVAAESLRAAAQCFDDEHDLVWAIWEFTGGMIAGDDGARKFARPDLRGRLAPLVRLARTRDAEAAGHLERALALLCGAQPESATPGNLGAVMLDGVPKVGYDKHMCPFPGSLHAVLEYLGDPVDYDYLMGVSGAAFRRLWNRDDGGNVDLGYLAPDVFRHLGEGIKYELRPVPRQKDKMTAAVRESLSRGRPVIAFGIIGPPEAGVVMGYRQGGEVLRGWSYFQEPAQTGPYEEADWFAKFSRFSSAPDADLGPKGGEPLGLIVVGDKVRWRDAPPRAILASSLSWIVDLARAAKRANLPQHLSGLAAYEAWAKGLETDADYPVGNAEVMGTRTMVHGDQCVMLFERRNAAGYLRAMAARVPEVSAHLRQAAGLYDETAALGPQVWPWGPGLGPKATKGLSEAGTRHAIAGHIRAAAAKEAQAVAVLEAALKELSGGRQ